MWRRGVLISVVALASVTTIHAEVVIQTVTVGNPGNAGEVSGEGPYEAIVGGVNYVYKIGKFEVTTGQYTEFLNAVADEDTYGLYNTEMGDPSVTRGCNIPRSGSPGSYGYTVPPDWADRPVNYVSWADAARFCNWLHNGQPTGFQDLTTTEDGSYFLNGATSDVALWKVVRELDATWVIPLEDEWYKAAYHKNDGVTGNYYDYPTSNDSFPSHDLIDPDPGNNANFYWGCHTIGSPYYRTVAGEFENSKSAYNTFDQGGNIHEWNETELFGQWNRVLHGGSFANADLQAAYRSRYAPPTREIDHYGFRVAEVPQSKCDIDFDGDVDLHDYYLFQDVGLHDYALLQAAFTGPR